MSSFSCPSSSCESSFACSVFCALSASSRLLALPSSCARSDSSCAWGRRERRAHAHGVARAWRASKGERVSAPRLLRLDRRLLLRLGAQPLARLCYLPLVRTLDTRLLYRLLHHPRGAPAPRYRLYRHRRAALPLEVASSGAAPLHALDEHDAAVPPERLRAQAGEAAAAEALHAQHCRPADPRPPPRNPAAHRHLHGGGRAQRGLMRLSRALAAEGRLQRDDGHRAPHGAPRLEPGHDAWPQKDLCLPNAVAAVGEQRRRRRARPVDGGGSYGTCLGHILDVSWTSPPCRRGWRPWRPPRRRARQRAAGRRRRAGGAGTPHARCGSPRACLRHEDVRAGVRRGHRRLAGARRARPRSAAARRRVHCRTLRRRSSGSA